MILMVFLSIFTYISYFAFRPIRSRANANTLTIKIKAQGAYRQDNQLTAYVEFYTSAGKVFETSNVLFTYNNGLFAGHIVFNPDFNFTDKYALFVKPDSFMGKLFCSEQQNGEKCKIPQFIFNPDGTVIDLTNKLFLAGDVNGDRKIDSNDIALIIKDLGKTTGSKIRLNTDINKDRSVDAVDFSLALYSLANAASDDKISLIFTKSQTITPTPYVSVTNSDAIITVAPTSSLNSPSSVIPTPTSLLSPTTAVTPYPALPSAIRAENEQILTAINRYRSQVNPALPPVRLNDKLTYAAIFHSKWMSDHNERCHECVGEPDFKQRMNDVNYSDPYGEIIAGDQSRDTGLEEVMTGWMNSPPHRNIIMSDLGTTGEIGVSHYGYYWTVDFGRGE